MPSLVRPARPADLDACLRLAQEMHAEAPAYRDRPFDAEKVARLLGGLCQGTAPGMVMFVAADPTTSPGLVVGGLIGCLVSEWFNDELAACELALFVAPGHRRGFAALRLVRAFGEWARLRGAVQVRAGSSTGVDPAGTARLYAHCGFEARGAVLVKEVGDVHGG